jgi:murein DD-endopeptidase MepM/ murein hydrolase activator NlpD
MNSAKIFRFVRPFFALCLFAALLPTPLVHAQTTGLTYTVKSGDNLSSIATDFHTSVNRILQINYVADPNQLNPGKKLILPGYQDVVGEVVKVTLPLGESLDSFNKRTRVPEVLLNRINFITNPDVFYAGRPYYIIYQAETPQTFLPVTAGTVDLELAVRQGVNPWLTAEYNHLSGTWAMVANEALYLPGSQTGTQGTSLPGVADLTISPLPLKQGKTTEIKASTSQPITLSGALIGHPLNFFPSDDGGMVALQGVERMAAPGMVPLLLTSTLADGSTFSIQQNLMLHSEEYGADTPLQVQDNTIDPAVTGPELDLVVGVVSAAPAEKLWKGAFVPPSPTPDCFTSTFGRLRSYNGSPYSYFHSGSDYCGNDKTPVYAAADGIVVYTGELTVRGNATIISHGRGVYSGYWHQSQINVSVGDVVQAGRVIGVVGDTGRVNGPHLHFEILVGGVQVDPADWLAGKY